MSIHVQVVMAWPRAHRMLELALPVGASVAEAVAAGGLDLAEISAFAVFGERVDGKHVLQDGDRVELLRPLQIDPKEARRMRAGAANR